MKQKKTDLELAQEHERKAKELRAKIRKEDEEKQRKFSEDIGRIVAEVIDRPLVEIDVEKFRKYATGIGMEHIKRAMS